MEAFVLTVLSVFAFIGAINSIFYIFRLFKPPYYNTGIRIILYLPQNSGSKLEGIIRQLFLEELPEKLMTDGRIYLMIAPDDVETKRLAENLKNMYPIEVLPDQVSYCMITDREMSN